MDDQKSTKFWHFEDGGILHQHDGGICTLITLIECFNEIC